MRHHLIERIALLLFAATTCGSAFGVGWGSNTVTITGYYTYASGAAFFTTSDNENPDGCTNDRYLALDATQPNFPELFATLVTAQATGNTVTVDYDGCTANNEYPLVVSIAIPKVW